MCKYCVVTSTVENLHIMYTLCQTNGISTVRHSTTFYMHPPQAGIIAAN